MHDHIERPTLGRSRILEGVGDVVIELAERAPAVRALNSFYFIWRKRLNSP